MATVNKPYLHTPTGAVDVTKSTITVTYTVTFDWVDVALNQPYRVLIGVWGDDTNVAGDGSGGADERRYWYYTRYILGGNGSAIQTFTDTFEPGTKWLNEDDPSEEPQHSDLDDLRVRVTLEPIKPAEFTSEESNLQQIALS